jgi:hypothetical protein
MSPRIDPALGQEHIGWKFRWDAGFNPAATLGSGEVLPVQYCFESDQTGPVSAGDLTNCYFGDTEVGTESLGLTVTPRDCASAVNPTSNACRRETYPYSPGEDGETEILVRNLTSLTGRANIYAQLPGEESQKIATFTGAHAGESAGYGTYGADASPGADEVEIWVSTSTADFSGPAVDL